MGCDRSAGVGFAQGAAFGAPVVEAGLRESEEQECTMTQNVKLAVIPGDGIGTEVVAEGLKVLDAIAGLAGMTLDRTDYFLV